MDDLVNIVVNNGLGIASFLSLIYFMFHYVEKINTVIEDISKTLVSIEKSLSDLSMRVERIEKDKE